MPELPTTDTMPVSDPQPISAALKQHFDEELSKIPTGKHGQTSVSFSTQGIGVGVGFRQGPWTAAGWAGRAWTSGWIAGGSVGFVF